MTLRTRSSRSTQALVVISPPTMATPVFTMVSQATRANLSSARMASSTASEIWSASLSGWPSETDSEVKIEYSLMVTALSLTGDGQRGDASPEALGKLLQLDLETVAQAHVQAAADLQSGVASPAGQVVLIKAQPEIPAGIPYPALVVTAQLGQHQGATRLEQVGDAAQRLGRSRHVVQHHIAHQTIRGRQRLGLQGIGQQAVDIVQARFDALLPGPLQHSRRVIQRQHPVEAAGQVWQKTTFTGAHFDGQLGGRQGQAVNQPQQRFPIQAEMGDQVLLGRGTVGEAGKELSGHLAALAVDRRNRLAQRRFQGQGIEAVQQLLMQLPPVAASIGQAA